MSCVSLRTVYFSIVDSKLQCGITCWGGSYYSTIHSSVICQNKVVRVMCCMSQRQTAFAFYPMLKILPLRYRYTSIYRVLRIFFLRGRYTQGNVNVFSNRLQSLNRMVTPFPKTEAYKLFYSLCAPNFYYQLPIQIP